MAAPVRPFKRFLPQSLFGRALLILVLPIVLLQAVLTLIIIQRHYDRVTAQMTAATADELHYAILEAEDAPNPAAAAEELARLAETLDLEIAIEEAPPVTAQVTLDWYDLTGREIAEELAEHFDQPLALDLVSHDKRVEVRLDTGVGILRVLIPRRRMNASNPHQILLWSVLAAVLLTLVATIFLRNQVRPIRQLARAAVAFGRGRTLAFRPSGAEEVRRAGHAFLDMRARIERQIEQRTAMLSAVSHDLRTPLTRMKLAVAVADETPETQGLARDVAEMEQMVEGFLAFARGQDAEPATPSDPVGLAEEAAEDAHRQGVRVVLETEVATPEAPLVELRRQAIKRCLANLLSNAAAHGREIRLTTRLTRRALEYSVEDDGPGIPEERRDEMFRPFVRLDQARGQDVAPGVGLGLTIALDIARSHGGSLTLDESPTLGGLRATLLIPR